MIQTISSSITPSKGTHAASSCAILQVDRRDEPRGGELNDEARTRYALATGQQAFELHARNTVTGETRTLTKYARNATAAYGQGFVELDAESGDRSWCFDGYTVRDL